MIFQAIFAMFKCLPCYSMISRNVSLNLIDIFLLILIIILVSYYIFDRKELVMLRKQLFICTSVRITIARENSKNWIVFTPRNDIQRTVNLFKSNSLLLYSLYCDSLQSKLSEIGLPDYYKKFFFLLKTITLFIKCILFIEFFNDITVTKLSLSINMQTIFSINIC